MENNIKLLIIMILFIIIYLIIDYIILRIKLGTLTGKFTHIKKPSGNLLLVQHKIKDKKKFLIATEQDIKILKELNYLNI